MGKMAAIYQGFLKLPNGTDEDVADWANQQLSPQDKPVSPQVVRLCRFHLRLALTTLHGDGFLTAVAPVQLAALMK